MDSTNDVIFIDTSVYIAENFFDKNNRITKLFGFAQRKRLSIVSTIIVNNELLSNFSSYMYDAFHNIKKTCNVMKNEKKFQQFIQTVGSYKKEDAKKICQDIILNNFRKANVFTIDYRYNNDVQEIFDKYFNNSKPFAEGAKKNEFPDAFTLQALENYCKSTGLEKIIILSNDKDLQKYQSKYLEYRDYKEYVSLEFKENNNLLNLENQLAGFKEILNENIKEDVEQRLNDYSLYNDYCDYAEISDVSIKQCSVSYNPEDYLITNRFKKTIELDINPIVQFEVDVTYQDLESGFYDSEDHCWYGESWITSTVSRNVTISLSLKYEIEKENLDVNNYDIDLDEINNSI